MSKRKNASQIRSSNYRTRTEAMKDYLDGSVFFKKKQYEFSKIDEEQFTRYVVGIQPVSRYEVAFEKYKGLVINF